MGKWGDWVKINSLGSIYEQFLVHLLNIVNKFLSNVAAYLKARLTKNLFKISAGDAEGRSAPSVSCSENHVALTLYLRESEARQWRRVASATTLVWIPRFLSTVTSRDL